MSARNFEAPPGLPAALRRARSAGKPCAADSACWGCTSVAGWKPKKTTNRRTDSLPCLGRTRASGWGDPPWVDSWATASKAASERLPSPAIICSGMSCRCGKWRSRFHFLSKNPEKSRPGSLSVQHSRRRLRPHLLGTAVAVPPGEEGEARRGASSEE